MSASPPPILSIIVPVYNVEPYLLQCLDSIAAQTLSDFEIILVNDGSTDKSGDICKDFASRDSRVHFIEQETVAWQLPEMQGYWLRMVNTSDS